MDDTQTQRRLDVLANQLAGQISVDLLAEQGQQIHRAPTSGQSTDARMQQLMEEGPEYAVTLPEKLQPEGSWQVYRCAEHHCGVLYSVSLLIRCTLTEQECHLTSQVDKQLPSA